ncbi:unnamed protein product, partial [Prunus brigantina]
MEIRIATRGKLGYLTGSIAMPAESAPTFDAWTTENLRVKGWLIDSMSPELMGRFIRLRTAKEIWAAVKKELDHRDPPSMVCAADTDAYQKKLDRLRVHIFLSGLDPEFDQVRSEILRKEPKLDLDQSFAYVRRDAQQRANFTGAAASLDATVMDILTRKIIGYGTRRGKLYFLDLAPSGATQISQAFKTSGDPTEKNQNFIWLWHRRVLNFQTPLQALRQFCALHSTPNLEPRVFGCVTFVHLYTHQRNKLEPRALKCVFIGYAQHQKGYRCYHPPTQKLYITMDVVFREEEMYFSGGVQAQTSPDTADDQFDLEEFVTLESLCHPTVQDALTDSSDTTPETMHESLDDRSRLVLSPTTQSPGQGEKNDVPVSEVSVPFNQLSSRGVFRNYNPVTSQNIDVEDLYLTDLFSHDPSNEIHLQPYQLPVRKNRGIPKIQYEADPKAKVKYPISNHVSTHRLSAPHAMLIKQLDSLSTPSSVEEALMDPNWKQAMNDEMQALQKNST